MKTVLLDYHISSICVKYEDLSVLFYITQYHLEIFQKNVEHDKNIIQCNPKEFPVSRKMIEFCLTGEKLKYFGRFSRAFIARKPVFSLDFYRLDAA